MSFIDDISNPVPNKDGLPASMATVSRQRLTIVPYADIELKHRRGTIYEAFYNPKEFSANYGVRYAPTIEPTPTESQELMYAKKDPASFNFSLKLDGTGAAYPVGDKWRGKLMNVDDEIEKFLKTAYISDGDTHRPSFLIISWGSALTAAVVINSLSVRKTLFSEDGRTLRADLECGFLEFENKELAVARLKLRSPDMTHLRTVQQGDKLPLMCERIYGDAKLYLEVARFNGLTNYRNLQPGQQLYFPPLIASQS